MLSIFDGLRDFTLMAVTVRMLLAVVCGGIIGIAVLQASAHTFSSASGQR